MWEVVSKDMQCGSATSSGCCQLLDWYLHPGPLSTGSQLISVRHCPQLVLDPIDFESIFKVF